MTLTVSTFSETPLYEMKAATKKTGFNNSVYSGYNTSSTEATEEPKPKKAAKGVKTPEWREKFIKSKSGEYTIEVIQKYSTTLGKTVPYYQITAKNDINLSKLEEDLGIRHKDVQNNNDDYGPNGTASHGHYIGNARMQNKTIKIPIDGLGYNIDERSVIEQIIDLF